MKNFGTCFVCNREMLLEYLSVENVFSRNIFISYSTFVPVPPEFAEWLRADYARRFRDVLEQLRAGTEPEDYRCLWYYEFCREVNCWDSPTSEQLLTALNERIENE